jgi:hypothetical protein
MPCHDPQPAYHLEAGKRRIDDLTDMLCRACRVMEQQGMLMHLFMDIRQWWEKHKEADKKREEAETARKERERYRKLEQYNKLKEELGL